MKAMLLLALLVSPLSRAAEPIRRSNYAGAIELEPQTDGSTIFRTESFSGQGILDQGGELAAGQRYVISGSVECVFGVSPESVFECASRFGSLPSLRVQVLEGPNGKVVKDETIESDYLSVVGTLVTTTGVNGSFQQRVVETNVYGRLLNLDLSLSF